MPKPLRYTGCWPTPDVLRTYPNWVFATDEEIEPGQDETTIKPEDQQSFVSDETDCTAARVTFADGTSTDAIISIFGGNIESVDAWDGRDWWRVRCDARQKTWTPLIETWLPEDRRRPSVSLSDSRRFPARVVSRLPSLDGPPLTTTIPLAGTNESRQEEPWYRFW